jgi:hypothetical protein
VRGCDDSGTGISTPDLPYGGCLSTRPRNTIEGNLMKGDGMAARELQVTKDGSATFTEYPLIQELLS